MRLQDALRQGTDLLERGGIPSPRLTAEVLLMHVVHCDRTHLYAHSERQLTDCEWVHYGRYLNERLSGKPAQYVTGHQEFWGLDFLVNPSVLIPRPETELVVETALQLAREIAPRELPLNIADVGTGSGCIAVAIATELPHSHIFALDNSPTALDTAQLNASRHNVEEHITFVLSDLLEPLSGEALPALDLLVSNPPYVAESDRASLAPEVGQHEPSAALFAGQSGTEVYARLIPQAARALAPGGHLVLELGYDVEERVHALLDSQWDQLNWRRDLAGITRVVSARRTARAANSGNTKP